MKPDEFVNNPQFEIVSSDVFGIQHIALKEDHHPLCGAKMYRVIKFDLFISALLCTRCEQMYLKVQP